MAKKSGSPRGKKANAESMAAKQRDISVSEFFAKNRHLLGFDNPRKALLTTIKEAVDNALDACEEAEILPDIEVNEHRAMVGAYGPPRPRSGCTGAAAVACVPSTGAQLPDAASGGCGCTAAGPFP